MQHPRRILIVLLVLTGLGCSARGLGDLTRDHQVDGAIPAVARPDAGMQDRATPPPQAPPSDARPPMVDAAEPTVDLPAESLPRPDVAAPADLAPPVEVSAPRPDAAPGGSAVLVVGSEPLAPDDEVLAARLRKRGLTVQICNDDDVATFDVSAARLIFVAASAISSKVGTTFRTLAKPVIVSDAPLFDDMALVEDDRTADPNLHGNEGGHTAIEIDGQVRPLAAGNAGATIIASAPITLNWATPPDTALRAAWVLGRPERVVLFGYVAGAQMVGLLAPARRVGLFLGEEAAASLNTQGIALLDAALIWALD